MQRRFVLPLFLLVAGVLGIVPRSSQADVPDYKVQPIARLGDTIGDLKIAANGYFDVGPLTDTGQLAFTTLNAAGGEMLFQYSASDGKFNPIVVGGRDAPGGKWPRSVELWSPVAMNQQGDMVFYAGPSGSSNLTTYKWDHQSGQVNILAAKDMPAVNDLTFSAGGALTRPAMNDYGDIAFQAVVKDSAGKSQQAIFFLGRDNKLTPVLLPGQTVAGVGTINPSPDGGGFCLNNAGVLGFQARRQGDTRNSVFIWENGTITPVLLDGADAPGGGKLTTVGGGFVNNKNRNVWVGGTLDRSTTHWHAQYMWTDGRLVQIWVTGDEMPGGGKIAELVSVSNGSTGEYAFTAKLDGGDTGAYRVDPDGKLSLIVKGSALGANVALPNPNWGIAVNSQGDVALPVRFTGDKGATLILLTPASPAPGG